MLFSERQIWRKLPGATERYGVEVNHYGMARCPFHNDRHPSLYVADDHYMCFCLWGTRRCDRLCRKAVRLAAL